MGYNEEEMNDNSNINTKSNLETNNSSHAITVKTAKNLNNIS